MDKAELIEVLKEEIENIRSDESYNYDTIEVVALTTVRKSLQRIVDSLEK